EAAARRAVREVLGLQRGQLTIWTLPTPGQNLLPPFLAAFRRAHPQIDITLREALPARAVAEAVAAAQADIGVVHLPYQTPGLAERILLEEDMALVVPAAHPLAGRDTVRLADVANEDFIF